MSETTQTYEEWVRSMNQDNAIPTQESKVNEDTTQELPAVAKLREAFDTARNAIIDGSELARQVEGLRKTVDQLGSEVSLLQRDLEYVRNRNKELDEQVTEVRRQRDNAISEGLGHKERADSQAIRAEEAEGSARTLRYELEHVQRRLSDLSKERDDAMVMALEYEGKLKEAEAKLAKILDATKAIFGADMTHAAEDLSLPGKPVPHYEVQPRDEVGKFQPFDEGKVYPSGSQGESSF